TTWWWSLAVACGLEDGDGVDEGGAVLLDDPVLEGAEGDRRVVDVGVLGDRGHGPHDLVWPGDAEVDRGGQAIHDAEDVARAEVGLSLHRHCETPHAGGRGLR